jgi:hypothetical protein
MKRIPQHGDGNSLYDITAFIPFLERRLSMLEWQYSVQWCSGEGASEIEKSANQPVLASHKEFCVLYKGIYQTIDGEFVVHSNEGVVRLLAVDSSFWEVKSDIPGIEDEFENEFGLYSDPLAQ